MSLYLPEKDRRVIPRWRDFRTTADTGELDGQLSSTMGSVGSQGHFEEKLALWLQDRRVETAADLVASALVLGRHQEAVEAARFLLSPEANPTVAVKVVAELVLSPEDQTGRIVIAELKDIDIEAEVVRLRVRALRAQLRDYPRNALLWVDLSRAYSMLGQRDQSIRAMERGLSLGRGNRFILRSAARLFVHVDDPDRAHRLLVQSDSTRGDPWLLAAEIAVAAVAERKAIFVRQGRQVLEAGKLPPLHTGELASALATLEMTSGGGRNARRLFRESLVDPTDNSLAQAGWAGTKMTGIEVAPDLLNRPRSFEARALKDYREGRWSPAIRQCEKWLLDEPFSSRPAVLASYLAIVTEQDYRLSEDFAKRGLRANPGDPLLLNNLTVALANQGQIEGAMEAFGRIHGASDELRPTLLATEGLLSFRRGDATEGRRLYLEARERARHQGNRRTEASAMVHLAREEMIAGVATASETVALATDACVGIDSSEIPQMLRLIAGLRDRPV